MDSIITDDAYRDVKVILIYSTRPKKSFKFRIDDTVWIAKQAVLLEFASLNLSDPLNYGFYMPPFKGKAGKFLDEERPLRDYPIESYGDHLEFRYKRRIYRSVNADEKKIQKYQTRAYQKKFFELLLTGNMEKVKKLLEKGLDPNFQDEKTGETPLTAIAMMPNSSEPCMLLVNYGAYLDYRSADGMTVLHKSIIHGRSESISCLLDLGASPNYKDAKGLTPLYHGILNGSSPQCCEVLLNDRAVIGVSDHQGSQEIHKACQHGREIHLDHLIFYGADINARTASGNTPLHISAIANQEKCALLLLFRGADKSLANYSNQTPYEVAVISGNNAIAALIEEFDASDVTPITKKPIYSKRRRDTRPNTPSTAGSREPDKQELIRTQTLPGKIDSEGNNEEMFLKRRNSVSKMNGKRELEQKAAVSDDSGSELSDSDEETNKANQIDRRAFSASGAGARRSPAPIKAIQGTKTQLKNRLYPSIPGRQFLAVIDYQPKAPGELAMERGDVVELLYIGEQGFWEGRIKERVGWFPSSCVEELKKTNKKGKNRTWFGRKSGQQEIIQRAAMQDKPVQRTVQVKKTDKGYGFQLRGANSHTTRIEFTPSPQFPALQYIGEIDKGGAAEKAGLKPGDFLLEVNGEDVKNATHGHVVSLVANSVKVLSLTVVTVAGEGISSGLTLEVPNMNNHVDIKREETPKDGMQTKKDPPPPLPRSQFTSLTMGPRCGSSEINNEQASTNTVDAIITLDKKVHRKRSVKSMWADTALKLNQPDNLRTNDVTKGVARRSKGLSMNLQNDTSCSDTDSGFMHRSNSVSSRSSNSTDILGSGLADVPGNATLPRRFSRSSSQGSEGSSTSDVSNRPQQPPGYEATIENMRRLGRTPSVQLDDKDRPVIETKTTSTVDVKVSNTPQQIDLPALPSYAPPPPPRDASPGTMRSVSVPAQAESVPHVSLGRSSSEPAQQSSDEEEPSSEFAKTLRGAIAARNKLLKGKKSIDDIIASRKKDKNLHVIKENEEATKHVDSSGMTKSSSSDAILQNKEKGSDYFSLYTASSTSSLDTQYSKDSGIDVSEVITQAPGEQPPDLASAVANAVAKRAERISNKEAANESKSVTNDGVGKKLSVTSSDTSITGAMLAGVKLRRVSAGNTGSNSTTISELTTPRVPIESKLEKTPPPTRPKPSKKASGSLTTDTAVEAISVSDASLTSDASSVVSVDSMEPPFSPESNSRPDIVTPPLMFVTTETSNQSVTAKNSIAISPSDEHNSSLPPPPVEFLAISDSIKTERQKDTQEESRIIATDPPPPYSPPRIKSDLPPTLSEKSYTKWTCEDVGTWLDFINMGQYKESFVDNDIQGVHLSELSKEDMSELGIKKLGHRLTIDDAINKLCRQQQNFSEV